jgi:putative membrane protein
MSTDLSEREMLRKQAEEETDPRVDLAVERTELALERTQLAWIRTSLTLLAGGIGLDKGLEFIRETRIEKGIALFENAKILGIVLSIMATLLMILSTWFYARRSSTLAKIKGSTTGKFVPALLASIIISILGIGISFVLLFT